MAKRRCGHLSAGGNDGRLGCSGDDAAWGADGQVLPLLELDGLREDQVLLGRAVT